MNADKAMRDLHVFLPSQAEGDETVHRIHLRSSAAHRRSSAFPDSVRAAKETE
jgi:hypothetical protein